jgi:hypothetical protein
VAADGIAETVRCGSGDDTAIVDDEDKTAACETIRRR